jgi:outer membrane lipoprotein SlyB
MNRTRRATAVIAAALAFVAVIGPADAKGCIKGALVGGVAGHYAAHHGLLGAAAGCVIGRHEANKREREQENNNNSPQKAGAQQKDGRQQ